MKDKQGLLFCFVLILFCLFSACESQPPEKSVTEESIEKVAQSDAEVAQTGFFSDLPRFLDPDEIRQIHPLASIAERLNQRYDLIIDRHRDLIKDARILDFGSYDGRWTYAAIDAGAQHVTAIEISPEFVKQAEENMKAYEVPEERYDFIQGDILDNIRNISPGSYDGVLCLGIFYHITYHVELLKELKRIGVKWIIMDTNIISGDRSIVWFKNNPNYGLEGKPTRRAIEVMVKSAGFRYKHIPTQHLTGPSTEDYQNNKRIMMSILSD